MNIQTAKRTAALFLASLMIILSGCSSGGSKKLEVKVNSPTGVVDTVAPEIRTFMDLAQNYVEGDYSTSEKIIDDLGNKPVETKFSWSFTGKEKYKSATVYISKNKDMSSPRTVELKKLREGNKVQSIGVYNLETGVKYYWQVEATDENGEKAKSEVFTFETKEGPRILKIDGVRNARDFGSWKTDDGKQIKQGIVYRTAKLNNLPLTAEDTVTKELGIKTELDLRNKLTEEDVYSPINDLINYVNISLSAYYKFLENTDTTAKAVRVFTIPENYPILFHCKAGADRTGTLAFVLGALCGVSETDLVIDYEITNGRYRCGYLTSEGEQYNRFPEFVMLFRAFPGNTNRERAYYFLNTRCGLSEMEIYNIVALLTSDSAVFITPPQNPVKIENGKAEFEIDIRSSKGIKSITANEKEYKYTLKGNKLIVTTNDTAVTTATVTFNDGAQMPLVWTP